MNSNDTLNPWQEKLAARTSKQDENEEDDARAQQAKEHLDLLKEDTAENNGTTRQIQPFRSHPLFFSPPRSL